MYVPFGNADRGLISSCLVMVDLDLELQQKAFLSPLSCVQDLPYKIGCDFPGIMAPACLLACVSSDTCSRMSEVSFKLLPFVPRWLLLIAAQCVIVLV